MFEFINDFNSCSWWQEWWTHINKQEENYLKPELFVAIRERNNTKNNFYTENTFVKLKEQ